MNKINFVVVSPDFRANSGGIIVLHKFADYLGKLGENSFINVPTYEGSSAKFLDQESIQNLDINSSMFIYPEIISGNPYSAKYVTRWLLNTPGVIAGDGQYGENDLIYKYWDYFKAPDESKVNGELRCIDLKLDIYFNRNNPNRIGECFLIKKGFAFGKDLNKHSSHALNIDHFISDEYLANLFNEKLMFISYDALTYHSIQAALCGCVSIVIPDPGISKEEWIEKSPINKYGIAYGLNDIPWAKQTMHLVKDHLLGIEEEACQLIKKYVSNCYIHIGK
jgi:hypothetical protein